MRPYVASAVVVICLLWSSTTRAQGTFLEEGEFGFSAIGAYGMASETNVSMGGLSASGNGRLEAGILFGGSDNDANSFAAPFISFIRQTPTEKGRSLLVGTIAYQLFDELNVLSFQFTFGYDYQADRFIALQPYVAPSISFPVSGERADSYRTDVVVAGGVMLYHKGRSIIPAVDASVGYDTQVKEMVITLGVSLTAFGKAKPKAES
jgi:hypothetical protein